MRRRTLLGLVAGSVLAGCGDAGDDRSGAERQTTMPETERPGLPYAGGSGARLDSPRGIRLRNASGRRRFTTVALDDGERSVFLDSRAVPNTTTVRYAGLVGRAGDYRVVVETGDGARHVRRWRVAPGLSDLLVTLDRGLTSRTTATCAPDCEDIALTGRAPGYGGPAAETDRRLVLVGPRARSAEVGIRLGRASAPDLDYRYRLPPAARVSIPAVGWYPGYPVAVRTSGESATRRWRRADGDRLFAAVDGRPAFRCGDDYHDLQVRNGVERKRTVELAVSVRGTTVVDERLSLPRSGAVIRRNAVPPAAEYAFRVTSEDGIDERYRTGICPPDGRLVVIVGGRTVRTTVRTERERTVVVDPG